MTIKFEVTPRMLMAAWNVVRDRWPVVNVQGHLVPAKGPFLQPGPGFKEAIEAAFAEWEREKVK